VEDLLAVEDEDAEHEEDEEDLQPVGEDEPHCRTFGALHKVGEGHRGGRVLSFFSSRRNWDYPNPPPVGECAPTLWPRGGGGRTLARGRRVGGVPIPTREHTLWYSV
jgi:hypothetical protein